MPDLYGPNAISLRDALLRRYLAPDDIEEALLHIDKYWEHYATVGSSYPKQLLRLVRTASSEGWLFELVDTAIQQSTGSHKQTFLELRGRLYHGPTMNFVRLEYKDSATPKQTDGGSRELSPIGSDASDLSAVGMVNHLIQNAVSQTLRAIPGLIEWDPFVREESEELLQDATTYPFATLALNNIGGEVDHKGKIPPDLLEKINSLEASIQHHIASGALDQNAIRLVRLAVIASTCADKFPFKFPSTVTSKVLARWRFIAVSPPAPEAQVNEEHVELFMKEIQTLLNTWQRIE